MLLGPTKIKSLLYNLASQIDATRCRQNKRKQLQISVQYI